MGIGWEQALIEHEDGLSRCGWPGTDPLYVAYHDEEWGVPEHDSRALFEKLLLDGFQAGLSWITILRKRDAFRRAFDGFDPESIARFDEARIETLMSDAAIVRNRAKIDATVLSARAFLALEAEQKFSDYLWGFVDGRPIVNRFAAREDVPASTPLAETVSKDLKARGFRFCGPTIVYAFMQAVGMVNDHLVGCHRHAACCDPMHSAGPEVPNDPPRAWQRMLSGRRLDLLDPSPLDIEIEDISHGLARVARWNGQTKGAHAFSVAQHSLLVEEIALRFAPGCDRRWRLAALLHDAPEYVIGDLISPFKAAVGLDYKAFELRLLAAIHVRFGLPAVVPQAVARLIKRADRAAAFLEATRLAGFGKTEAARFFGPLAAGALEDKLESSLEPQPPIEVSERYLKRFGELR